MVGLTGISVTPCMHAVKLMLATRSVNNTVVKKIDKFVILVK